MELNINYTTDEEREKILKDNSKLFLIKDVDHLNEKYLIFSDKPMAIPLSETEKLNLEITKLKEEQKQQDKILLENSLKLAMLDIK